MTIADVGQKCKTLLATSPRDLLIFAILILVALVCFGLGYVAGLDASDRDTVSIGTSPFVDSAAEKRVVASKTGTKYYLGWCGGADRISPENQVWFDTPAHAEAAGYTSAANCAGL